MAITTSHQQEALSLACLQAVVADCGMTLSVRDTDYGVDASLYNIRRGSDGRYFEVGRPIDIQLKSTTIAKLESDTIRYDLNVRNYAHLRDPTSGVPRILILCVLASKRDWVTVNEASTTIRGCLYWRTLKGVSPTRNRRTVRVDVPRSQVISPNTLKPIVESLWKD